MDLKEFSIEVREWSRETVNHHMLKDGDKNGRYKYVYSVRICLEPNPLDSIKIELVKKDQKTNVVEVVATTKQFSCCRLDEVIAIVKSNREFLD